jgi:multidrug resistance efflux pump
MTNLSPVARVSRVFQAHILTRPPRLLLLFSLIMLGMLGVIVVALIVVPWRQTVVGQGEVSIFDPMDRPQTVDSQIKGRLVELLVKEGDVVEAGQVMAKLEDLDSKFLGPQQTDRLNAQIEALEDKKSAAYARMESLAAQVNAIEDARVAKLASAEAKVQQTQQKLRVDRQMIQVGEQDLKTAQLQEQRIEKLESAGLKSRRDFELTIQKRVEAEMKLQKMTGELLLAEQEIQLARLEAAKINAEAAEKSQKAQESSAKARETIAEIDEKVQKLSNEAGALKVRRSLQTVVAPRAGRVVNLKKLGLGQLLKEGQTIAYIVPENQSRGVELYLSGIDAPLVENGVNVRLMFEGFPAVPFAGWDWATVGTFGGVVASVDPVNTEESGKSGYRIWVLPDPNQPAWPDEERLRIGSKASGWLMLNRVPLYYELWRQLNAFPAQPSKYEGKQPKTKPVIRR